MTNFDKPGRHFDRSDVQSLLMIVVSGLILFLPSLSVFGPIDPSDVYYSEASREMMDRHDYLTPYLNYHPYYEKPILVYWLIIASYRIFGVHQWAARLPSALFAILTAAVLFVLLRYFVRRRAAFIAALALVTSPLYAVIGHLALTDMPLTFLVTLSMLCFLKSITGGGKESLLIGYVATGLAILLKGPLAIILLSVPLVLYLFLQEGRKGQSWLAWLRFNWVRLGATQGLILVLCIALPWYIAEAMLSNGQFLFEFFVQQNVGRFIGTTSHVNPWFYYIPFAVGGFLPWTVIIFTEAQALKFAILKRQLPSRSNKIAFFSLLWAVVVFMLFSLAKTKLATYILPMFPPLAILVGLSLDRSIRLRRFKQLFFIGCLWLASYAGCLVAYPTFGSGLLSASGLAMIWMILPAVSLGIGLTAYVVLVYLRYFKLAVYQLLFCLVLSMSILVPDCLYLYDQFHDEPLRLMLSEAQANHANLALFLRGSPAAVLYLKHSLPVIFNESDYQQFFRSGPSPHWLLVPKETLQTIAIRKEPFRTVDHRARWYLLERQ